MIWAIMTSKVLNVRLSGLGWRGDPSWIVKLLNRTFPLSNYGPEDGNKYRAAANDAFDFLKVDFRGLTIKYRKETQVSPGTVF